jgi:hypothetical protein
MTREEAAGHGGEAVSAMYSQYLSWFCARFHSKRRKDGAGTAAKLYSRTPPMAHGLGSRVLCVLLRFVPIDYGFTESLTPHHTRAVEYRFTRD